jgi:hypothetical protein
MNEQEPKDPAEELVPVEESVIAEVVGQVAAKEVLLKGAGTLSEVMGSEAAVKYVQQSENNRRKSLALARRIYGPMNRHQVHKLESRFRRNQG